MKGQTNSDQVIDLGSEVLTKSEASTTYATKEELQSYVSEINSILDTINGE